MKEGQCCRPNQNHDPIRRPWLISAKTNPDTHHNQRGFSHPAEVQNILSRRGTAIEMCNLSDHMHLFIYTAAHRPIDLISVVISLLFSARMDRARIISFGFGERAESTRCRRCFQTAEIDRKRICCSLFQSPRALLSVGSPSQTSSSTGRRG
jgi:hypothetical protein